MRIDHLQIENFKKFSTEQLDLHPQFTLLAGENGSGKTSVLDALAVALGLWHKAAPGSGWRNILAEEIRLEPVNAGDRTTWRPALPTRITARGSIGDQDGLTWTRMIREGGYRTTNAEARQAEMAIAELVARSEARQAPLPVLAYYGAGRAWESTNKRRGGKVTQRKPQQFDAYRNCLDTRIRDQDLNEWFLFETAAARNEGEERCGFVAVKTAVLRSIPNARDLRYDADLKEIVLSIGDDQQPYYNLSGGQRMMLAMVADIAIKAVTLNSYLLGTGQPGAADPLEVLQQSPGIVLIDELDVHLHPRWQRRVASNLMTTFPRIQFVCTSHSPQVIGEVQPESVRFLTQPITIPNRSFGIDSSRILEELMSAKPRNENVEADLERLFEFIDEENFAPAETLIQQLNSTLGSNDPELTRARALMAFLQPKS